MPHALALKPRQEIDRAALVGRFADVRRASEALCAPLAVEDYVVQSMSDTSPPKWHLAHITWFFEQFVLGHFKSGYEPFHPRYGFLFNSYYETVGEFFPRAQRGLLSRPTVDEVYRYRAHVDREVTALIETIDTETLHELAARIELGLHHEQQHQELLLTDVKHALAMNPLYPAYAPRTHRPAGTAGPLEWLHYEGGVREIGHGGTGFAFDNERPRHATYVQPFQLAARLVTNGEYLAFMAGGGYERPELWLSEGWRTVRERAWRAPLYWQWIEGAWWHMTLAGLRPVDLDEPVCHVSYYEADAYARWADRRLPTEPEWEIAARSECVKGNFRDAGILHPAPADGARQFFGDVWEWTSSSYAPYPGYRPLAGSLGEYNGKFMVNQYVLRGGSCATPASHMRVTYRNFFYAPDRWQFMGIRLAQS
jgi:ergothioneine biosynthesis protein EgtB